MPENKGLEEDFPLLPAKKQKPCATSASRRSSISSVSSMSICQNVGTEQDMEPWFVELVQDVVCRRFMFCRCEKCITNQVVMNKRKWNSLKKFPCEDAVILRKYDIVKVIRMKNYGRRGEVRAFVLTSEEDGTEISGWVHPDCLGGVEAVRFALEQKKVADNLRLLKKDFQNATNSIEEPVQQQDVERKQIARFVPAPTAPKSKYQFKELVLARDALGHPWYRAEVLSTNPLTLKSGEFDGGRVFDERNVKKHPTSNFVVVRAMKVRTAENPGSFVKTALRKGTVVGVVKMNGYHAQITSPVCGWVQMRTADDLHAIEQNYKFQMLKPRLFLGGLPAGANRTTITRGLQKLQGDVLPSNIEIFLQGENLCAFVSLMKPSHYKKVAAQNILVNGQRVNCDWCINYLRCKAARELRRTYI